MNDAIHSETLQKNRIIDDERSFFTRFTINNDSNL